MHVSSGTHAFLQTAQVVVSRPGEESAHSLKVRAIFYTGAQWLYITEETVNALKLQTVKTERLERATFGDKKKETEAVNLVELALTKPERGFEINLNASAVPHICADLQGQEKVKENLREFKRIS